MNKSFTLTIASIFAILLLVGLTSAAVNFFNADGEKVTTLIGEGNHGNQVTINFLIENDHTDTLDNIDLSNTPTLIYGTYNLPASNLVASPNSITSIPIDSNSTLISLQVNIPNLQQTGIYTGVWNIESDRSTSPHPVTISLEVLPSHSLALTGGTMDNGANTTEVVVTNTGNTQLNGITLTTSTEDVETNYTSAFNLNAGISRTFSVQANSNDLEDLVGTQTIATITASQSNVPNQTADIVYQGDFCEYGELDSDLEIELEITDVEGLGDEDDEEFLPLDKVTFEVNVDNKGDHDIQDIELEWGIYNTDTGEWFVEPEEADTFDLDEGDDTTIEVTFEIEDADDLGGENYVLYVRATGEIDNSDSANDGEKVCVSEPEDMDIILEGDLIVLRNIEMPVDAFCGQDAILTAEIWNIGEDDQDDITITIFNNDLDVNEQVTFDTIDAFDKEEITLQFSIPSGADGDKTYYFIIEIRDDDNDLFEYDGDDLDYNVPFTIAGGCISIPDMTIVPSLISERAVAGEEVLINATITNTGTTSQTYTLSLSGTDSWSEEATLDRSTMIIQPGQTETVQITLTPNKGIEGTETFTVNAVTADGSAYAQPVSVSVEDDSFNFGDSFNLSGMWSGNSLYWIIGAINVILIIAIIIVVVRILSSKN